MKRFTVRPDTPVNAILAYDVFDGTRLIATVPVQHDDNYMQAQVNDATAKMLADEMASLLNRYATL